MTGNLKERTAKGLFWSSLNNGTIQVLNLVFGIVLARLLTPDDYGIVGVLAVFGAIAVILQNSGFTQALINLKNPSNEDYNSVFWFNVFISLVIYLLLFCCAPLIAIFFHQPCLEVVSRVLFLSIPILSLGLTSNAYLLKNMMNREIAIIGVGALFFSGLAGIALAVQGYSYWSLVWMQLLNALFITVGRLWFVRWLPSLSINFGPVRRMFGFGVKILITGLMQALNFHLLTFIFGRYLPIQTVGYYSQANKWNNLAKTTIADTVGQVAQAVLVSVSDEKERELRVFRKMMRFTAFLSFPAMLGLAMVAREFILFLLGDQWESSVILLQILCVGGAFLPFYTLYQNLAISNERSDLYMWCNIGQMVIQLLIVLLTYSYGIETVLWCCSVFNILWLLPWLLVAHRLIGLGLTEVLKDMAPFLLISLAVMFVTYMLTMGISQLLMLLVVRIVVAAGLYVVVMKMLNVAILKECLQFVKGKKVKE